MSSGNDIEYAVRVIDEATATTEKIIGGNDALNNSLVNVGDQADETSGNLDGLKQKTEETGEQSSKAGLSFTELSSAMNIANQAIGMAEQAYDATIGKAAAYGETIRNLSVISGQSTEQTSRMVQVLDDWQVSAQDVEAATRKMTANGLAPSLDTIATLGEEYRKITDAEEKNKFVTDNLGRSGQAWNQVLGMTREELQAASAAVNENLVLTKQQVAQLEQLRLVQDSVADTADSIAISLGTNLAPVMANILTAVDDASKGQNNWQQQLERTKGLSLIPIVDWSLRYNDALTKNEYALKVAAEAEKEKTAATISAAEADRIATEQASALSTALTATMGIMQQIDGQTDSYAKSSADLATQQASVNAQLQEAGLKYGANSSQVADLRTKLEELTTKQAENAAANTEATNQIVANAALQKLAQDGLTQAEFEKSQAIQVGLGLISQADADKAIAVNKLAEDVANSKISVEEFNTAVKDGSLEVKRLKEEEGRSWSNYASAVSSTTNESIASVQQYINKLNEIPKEINTKLTQTIEGESGGPGAESGNLRAGGAVINIENLYLNSISELVSLVG